MTRLRLLVLRTHDLAVSRAIYEALGLRFRDEQHGQGPAHLSAVLGFAVADVDAAVTAMRDRAIPSLAAVNANDACAGC
jgi:hypothetical protein